MKQLHPAAAVDAAFGVSNYLKCMCPELAGRVHVSSTMNNDQGVDYHYVLVDSFGIRLTTAARVSLTPKSRVKIEILSPGKKESFSRPKEAGKVMLRRLLAEERKFQQRWVNSVERPTKKPKQAKRLKHAA